MTMRKRSGMTLIEILFSVAIIGTVLTVAYSAALSAWRSAASANQRSEAQYVAQNSLETIKSYRDLSTSPTAQKRMLWSGATNGGLGGFLQELRATVPSRSTKARFNVLACSELSPTNPNCEWIVQAGNSGFRARGDSTDFGVYVETNELFCSNTATPSNIVDMCGGDPLAVVSVTLQSTVSWRSFTGIDSSAIASTILTEPE